MVSRAKRGRGQVLDQEGLELVAKALKARIRAYAPYSRYRVGAALLTKGGECYVGCNIENSAYGLCLCAERVAMSSAVAAGKRDFVAMAIATDSVPPASPCGSCLQFMSELGPGMRLLLCNPHGDVEQTHVEELLPRAFGTSSLKSGQSRGSQGTRRHRPPRAGSTQEAP